MAGLAGHLPVTLGAIITDLKTIYRGTAKGVRHRNPADKRLVAEARPFLSVIGYRYQRYKTITRWE